MKKQYTYPRTSVSTINNAWYLMQSTSGSSEDTGEFTGGNTSSGAGSSHAPGRKPF